MTAPFWRSRSAAGETCFSLATSILAPQTRDAQRAVSAPQSPFSAYRRRRALNGLEIPLARSAIGSEEMREPAEEQVFCVTRDGSERFSCVALGPDPRLGSSAGRCAQLRCELFECCLPAASTSGLGRDTGVREGDPGSAVDLL